MKVVWVGEVVGCDKYRVAELLYLSGRGQI